MGTVVIEQANGLHENWEGSARGKGYGRRRHGRKTPRRLRSVWRHMGAWGLQKELAPLLVRRSWRSTSCKTSVKTRRRRDKCWCRR